MTVRRIIHWLLWTAFAVVAVEGLLWQGVPAAIRALAPGVMQSEIGRTLTLGVVQFNPLTLQLRMERIRIFRANGGATAVTDAAQLDNKSGSDGVDLAMASLEVDLSAASFWKRAPILEKLDVAGLQVNLARDADGRLSIDDVLERLAAKPASPEPARYALNNVRVRDASLIWTDAVKAQSVHVRDIALELPFLSTLPNDVQVAVQPRLQARVDHGDLLLTATAKPFGVDRVAELALSVQQLPLVLAQPWLPKSAGVQLDDGHVQAQLTIAFRQSADTVQSLTVDGRLMLTEVKTRLALPDKPALDLQVPTVTLTMHQLAVLGPVESASAGGGAGAPASAEVGTPPVAAVATGPAASRSVGAENATAAGGAAPSGGRVTLDADLARFGRLSVAGQLRLAPFAWHGQATLTRLDLLAITPFLPPVPVALQRGALNLDSDLACHQPAGATQPDCTVQSARAVLTEVRLLDTSPAAGSGGVTWEFPAIKLDTRQLHWPLRPAAPVDVAVEVDIGARGTDAGRRSGRLRAEGRVWPSPVAAEMRVQTEGVDLPLAQPYLSALTPAKLKDGLLDSVASVNHRDGRTQINLNAEVHNLRLLEPRASEPLLAVRQFGMRSVDVLLDSAGLQSLRIGGIKVAGLKARVERDASGQLNWLRLLPPASAPDTPAQKPAAAEPLIELGVVELEGTDVLFTDDAVAPAFSARLTDLKGQMSAFSTRGPRRARLELTGSLDGDGLLVVSGQLDPLKPRDYLNISLRARGIEMTRLSPYAAKYAGYSIAKGKLSTTLNYRIENGALVAENALFLDQLNFGDAVKSPDATTLPVRLAVALLKNLKGEIDLNLPVKGSLNDPQFSIGEVVFKALGNLILKAVASPFTAVASLFTEQEAFAGTLEFEAGSSALSAAAERQLKSLVNTLVAKSDLELEITGYADLLTDSVGLQQLQQKALVAGIKAAAAGQAGDADRAGAERTAATPVASADIGATPPQPVDAERIRALAYERAVAARNAIVALKPELSERLFLVAPSREQLGRQAEKPRRAVDFALR